MKIKDDRTTEQKKTHVWAVVARDKFLSGWGGARGGKSRCAWAVSDFNMIADLEKWVRSRSDMTHVNIVKLDKYRAPKGTAHFHIYVADKDHPALCRM